MKKPKIKRIKFEDGSSTGGFNTGDDTLVLKGKAAPGAKVKIFDNGELIGTVKANKKGKWKFETDNLDDGAHGFQIKAKGSWDGGATRSKVVSGEVDTAAPEAPGMALSVASDTGSSSSDGITADATPTLGGTAEAGVTVTIRDGATVLGTAVADAAGNWVFTTSPLADGTHAITATASDATGNASAPSPVLTVVVDTAATGTIVLDAIAPDNIVNIAEGAGDVTITGTVTGEIADGTVVTVTIDGTEYTGTVAGGVFAIVVSGAVLLADADLTIAASVTAEDTAGNTATLSDTQAYGVDQTPPSGTITITAIALDDVVNIAESTATVVVSGTVAGDVPDGATVTVTVNGTDFTGTVSGGAFAVTVDGADLVADAGLKVVASVTLTDAAGNTATATDEHAYSIDLVAPTGTILLGPVTADGIVNIAEGEGDVAITGTVSGDVPDGATVTLTVNGSEYTGTVASGAFSIDVPGAALIADGDLTVDASVSFSDAAGNEGSATDTQTYTLDQEAPTGTLTLDSVTADDVINIAEGEEDVAITGTVGGDVPDGATVTLTVNGKEFTGTVSAGAFSIDVPGADLLADTGLSVSASVAFADAAGNSGSASDSAAYTLDQEAPEAATITGYSDDTGDVGDGVTEDTTLTLTGTAGAGLEVEIFDGTTSLGSTTADGNGDWSFDTDALEGGDHSFTAVAIDAAGNAAEASSALEVTIETSLVIDLSTLTAAQGVVIQGDAAGDQAGWSVSSAGDVNGDGYDDIIVGARYGNDGGTSAGEAYVIFGSVSGFGTDVGGRQVIDLTSLTAAQGFVIQGDYTSDRAGTSVSSAGDINGDGYDDLIVGAPGGDDGATNAGEAYVVFGSGSGFGTDVDGREVVDLTSLSAAQGFIIQGDAAQDQAGSSVSSAGDVNGDGYDDMIVAASLADGGGFNAGEAYVVFGSASGFGTNVDGRQVVDLTSLSAAQGFVIQGDAVYENAGVSVSSAGDINGDGYDDLIVGSLGDNGAGEAYVVFGSASGFGTNVGGRQVIDLASLTAAEGFVIQGDASEDYAGTSVSSAGDVNGDGYDDVIVGARKGDDGGNSAGEAYVIFGSASGFGTNVGGSQVIDLTSLSAAQGFVIQGDVAGDYAGVSVASAGDVNGDGFDDLIVGATHGDDGGSAAGEAYVVFGSASGFGSNVDGRQVIDLSSLSAEQGFIIQGDAANDNAGRSVSAAGDINGDGYDDLLVGAPQNDNGGANAGAAYIVYGGAFGGSLDPVTTAGNGTAEMLIGGAGDDTLSGGGGADVIRSGAGDDTITVADVGFLKIDGGTGSDTLVLGGSGLSLDLTDRVQAAKIDGVEAIDLGGGGNTLVVDQLAVLNETPAREGRHVLTVRGSAGSVEVSEEGWRPAGTITVGDTTYDRYRNGDAELRVEQGVAVALPPMVIDATTLTAAQGFVIQGDAAGDQAGFSVSGAGDVNGDGYDDIIVGARRGGDGGSSAGEAYVIFGSESGFGTSVDGRQVIDLTSLSAAQGFIVQGDEANDWAGVSVSSAGDVNGDGYDDLIVGAKYGDDGGGGAGEAYVVFGSGSGFGTDVGGRQVIDLTSLSAAQGFIIQGDAANDQAGFSVSSAGDVNGDGYDDLIVGAKYGDDGGSNAGEAYVVFGTASGFGTDVGGRQVIDLSSLTAAEGFVVQGDAAGDWAGFSVSSAGDVNGDGYDDLIVGAVYGDDGGSNAGEAYVVFGSASGFGTDVGGRQVIDLSSLSPAQGFVIQGDVASDTVGWSVSSAGDVNGDGYDDLIVGAPYGDDAGNGAGEAYVVFGSASGFGTDVGGRQVIDLSSLSAAEGFVIWGDAEGDRAGYSVSSAGDVNGDGYDDLIVGARGGDDGGGNAGEAYVIFGSASGFGTSVDGRQVVDLTSLSPTKGFIIQGDATADLAGRSVSSAGDLNGDGYDDLIVGAPYGDDGGENAGEAYVVFGGAFGSSTTPVTTTGTADVEMLIGGAGDDGLSGGGGADVIRSGAGDDTLTVADLSFLRIDGGTGNDTLVLAGSALSLDLTDRLQAARIDGIEAIDLGGNGNTLVVDKVAVLNETPASDGGTHVLTVLGEDGDTVDLDGDGWSLEGTIVVDTVTFDRYVNGNAEVRVEQGVQIDVAMPAPVIDLGTLSAAQGFVIQGDVDGDNAGWSVSGAGDVNGDGYADLIVGAFRGDDGGINASEAYVVFGSGSGFGTDVDGRQVIDLTSLTAAQGFIIQGDAAGDYAGWSVSSAGDVNGDGYDDLIVDARDGDDGGNYAGEAYVVFGSGSGFGTAVDGRQVIDLTSLSAAEGFVIQGDAAGDMAGWSVSSAGDVNGDGYDDLIVGAPGGDNGGSYAGEAYVVFGSGSGFGTNVDGRQVIDLTSLTAAQGFIIQGDAARDYAGWSVSSAGDVNGDGYDDIVVGAKSGDDGGSYAGEAYVVFGSGSGFGTAVDGRQVIDLTSLTAAEGFIIQGDAAGDYAGWSVSSAGDVNGDGYDDIVVGAKSGDDGGINAGEAYVVFGSASGFGTDVGGRQVIDLTTLTAAQGFIIQGDTEADQAGRSVSAAGDVNGDGYGDLIVGAPYGDDGGSNAGEAYVVFGSGSGFGSNVDGRQVVDLSSLTSAEGFIIQADAEADQAGRSVSAAGDVNGDGYDDLIVGAPYGDDGGDAAGEAYIVYGGAFGSSTTPVTTEGTAAAEILIGGAGDDALSGGGDADVIRSGAGDDTITVTDVAFRKIDGGTGSDTLVLDGTSLSLGLSDPLVAAQVDGIERIDLAGGGNTLTLDPLAVRNEAPASDGGTHVLTVLGEDGDTVALDGDGWSLAGTIVVDTVTFDRYVNGNAEVRVEQGVAVALPPMIIDLTTLTAGQGFVIQGDEAGDNAGWSVSEAGDVNGDGYDDMIVGAPRSDSGGNNAGESYVIFGTASGFGTDVGGRQVIDLSTLPAAQGFVIQGDAAFDQVGRSVSSAGDINGDGYDDLIVGAFSGDDGGDGAGEAYVVFGSGSGFGTAIDGRQVIDLTSLSSAQGFVIQGVDASDLTGISVSAAGDVNGDGYDDLIVGAPYADDGGSATGAAHVVFGSASGFGTNVGGRQVIDLGVLTAAEGFVIRGDSADDRAGWSVSSAGDVNGDGCGDLIVGARLGDDGGTSAGEAYVVFGSGSGFGTAIDGRQVIALDALTAAQGFVIQGDEAGDQAGGSVSSAGDVNGDGYDDLIVGARQGDDGGNNAGEAYVVFGSVSGFGTDVGGRQVIDLTSLTAAQGFVIQGNAAGDSAGFSVSSAGDINGDGYDDLIVGAAYGGAGGSFSGQAYVIFGSASGFGTAVDGRQVIDLTNLTAAQGFIIAGDAAGDYAGYSVSAAGDVNGDGYADLMVGARQGDDGGENAGEAYIVYGGAFGSSTTPVTTEGTGAAEILIGGAGDDTLAGGGGIDVIRSGAGDDTITVSNLAFRKIDGGSGSDTLALAAGPLVLDLTDRLQAAKIDGIEVIDLGGKGNTLVVDKLAVLNETPAGADGVHILTVRGTSDIVNLNEPGWSLAGEITVGDTTYDRYVNGDAELRVDQTLEIILAAPIIELATLSEAQGFVIEGDGAGDNAGFSVSSAGDVNGDGYDDLIVGARRGNDGGDNAGEAYVVFGSASGFGTDVGGRQVIDLTSLTAGEGFVIQGDSEGDYAGFSVSSAGDVNGDGYDDLIVGASGGNNGGSYAGEAYVVFGSASGFGTDVGGRQVIDLTSLTAAEGFVIQGDTGYDYAGRSVSSAGDVNGDGLDDLIVGASGGDDGGENAGEAYVIFGTMSGFGSAVGGRQVIDLSSLTAAEGFVIQGDAAGDNAGFSVSSAGDVNGDGYGDVIVGAREGGDGGEAYVLFGAASGFGTDVAGRQVIDLASLTAVEGFVIQGADESDLAGWSVSSAGDVNGDGYDDLVVGAQYGDDAGWEAGEAYVVFGSATGFGTDVGGRQVIDLFSLTAAQGFVIQGDTAYDFAGFSVSSAGDVNGDGFADLIVGAPGSDNGGDGAGEAYVIFGSASGFGTDVGGRQVIDLANLTAAQGVVIRGAAASDGAGFAVSAAGDVNGDGFDDLIVGAPYGDDGGSDAGAAYIVYGGPFGESLEPIDKGVGYGDGLAGGPGDDSLYDVFSDYGVYIAGAGDDTITNTNLGFMKMDGGSGTDTLLLDGSDQTLDLTDRLMAARIDGIERYDLYGNGNVLVVDKLAVLNETPAGADGVHVLTVLGSDGATLRFDEANWSLAGTVTEGAATFDRYVSGNAEVRVQQGVVVEWPSVVNLASLASGEGFVILGDAAYDKAGWSVSGAGDVNGDGFDDVIVGVPYGDDGGSSAGEAYVVFGSASGFGTSVGGQQVVDLTSLTAAQGFIIQGDIAGDKAGFAVSAAGDVNGDGYDDLIVGAQYGDDGGSSASEAYVVFGSASGFGTDVGGRQVIDLTTLTAAQGFVIQGDAAGDQTGRSVASAGDVNGDGYDDLIVGALLGDDGGDGAGEAYVVFGSGSGFGTDVGGRQVIDLSTLTAAEGFVIQGDGDTDRAGWSVSSAGDVNGDGYGDLIVGAPYGDDGASEAGEAYVVFGSASGFGSDVDGRQVIDLTNLSAAEGFIIQGVTVGDQTGKSVASVGDINGDGYDDLVVGGIGIDGDSTNNGGAYVVFGSGAGFGVDVGGRQVVDLAALGAAQGFVIQGSESFDNAGASVSAAGDINGDGYGDLIIGAATADGVGNNAGAAYVVFGSASGFGTNVDGRRVVDLGALASPDGFVIAGASEGDSAGASVSAAGDVNGDGFDDLIVGAKYGSASYAGEAYVLFGAAFGGALTTTTGTAAAEILVGGAGDDVLSGGGGADVIRGGAGDDAITVADVGFFRVDGGTGSDTLVLGGSGLTLDLSDPLVAAKIEDVERIDLSGGGNTLTLDRLAVLNETPASGDGVHVLTVFGFVGATLEFVEPYWGFGGTVMEGDLTLDRYVNGNAEVRVEQGVVVTIPPLVIDMTTLTAAEGFIIQGDEAGDGAGWSVSAAGDVNGDGYDDLIVGAIWGDDGGGGAGEAYVVFGSASGFGTDVGGRQVIDLTSLSAAEGFIIQGDAAADYAGYGVSSAGDVNGDGFDDLIVGAFDGDDGGLGAGEAYVVFGKASGFGTDVGGRQVIDLTSLSAAEGFIIRGDEAGDGAGRSVSSVGDVNGDGYDDVIVGARVGDDGGVYAGEAYVVFGSASGFGTDVGGRQVIDLSNLTAAQGFVIQGDAAGDRAGFSVSSAGDVDGDGYDDLIVAAPLGDDGGSSAGEAYVIFGTATGFGSDVSGRQVVDLTTLTAAEGFVIQGDAAGDRAGWSVSSAGDVNGDGHDDLIVGAPYAGDGVGEAYVVFGSASGFGTDVGGRQVIDLTSLTASQGFIIRGDSEYDYAGRSVSSAGDVNGDGYDDVIVGATGGADGGEAYVIFGSALGFGTDIGGRQVIDLTGLSAAEGFIIQSDAADDKAGYSVSSAGDVNGDGYDDLVVGTPYGDDGGDGAGEAYIVYGGAFGGSLDPVTTTGTVDAEILIGRAGDDVLAGGGGADVIRSGAGNDTITVTDLDAFKVDGGTGSDTLHIEGTDAGLMIDFTTAKEGWITGIEAIDTTSPFADLITIGALDVFDFSETIHEDFTGAASHRGLVVRGDASDVLYLENFTPTVGSAYEWVAGSADVHLDGSSSGDYDTYDLMRDGEIVAVVAVDSAMNVVLPA